MSLRKPSLAALVVLGLLAGCGDDSGDEAGSGETTGGTVSAEAEYDITGSWSGELRQSGLEPFTVTATIDSLEDAAENTVQYTGIDCGGNWAYLGREGAAFRFREVIVNGAGGNCKGVGIVTLTPFSDDGVDYEFNGGGVRSAGVLKRTG